MDQPRLPLSTGGEFTQWRETFKDRDLAVRKKDDRVPVADGFFFR